MVTFEDVTVAREFATSTDGTLVPVNILVPKGVTLDGSNPCLATGYGGYGISLSPRVRPAWRVLFDHGFVVAVANLRGGGEYGEAWHRAGNLVNKQHVFDDFTAVLRHLTERRYTSPARLAIEGGSNGGLLMGAVLTQHPELVACSRLPCRAVRHAAIGMLAEWRVQHRRSSARSRTRRNSGPCMPTRRITT